MSLPNKLTVLRILIIPFVVGFLIYSHNKGVVVFRHIAAFLFFVSALTDAIDGFIARGWGQGTELGRFLDPLADKLLILTTFVILTLMKEIPVLVAVVVISRDVILTIGWVSLYLFANKGAAFIRPSLLGKATAFLQMFTLLLFLLDAQQRWYSYIRYIMWPMVILTIFSTLEYIQEGSRRLNGSIRE